MEVLPRYRYAFYLQRSPHPSASQPPSPSGKALEVSRLQIVVEAVAAGRLMKAGFVEKVRKGKRFFYRLKTDTPIIQLVYLLKLRQTHRKINIPAKLPVMVWRGCLTSRRKIGSSLKAPDSSRSRSSSSRSRRSHRSGGPACGACRSRGPGPCSRGPWPAPWRGP